MDAVYKDIFMRAQDGYAYHKIMCNDKDQPVNYTFLDVNPAFEEITGLKRSEIVGNTATQVHSGINNEHIDWIAEYGEVAISGNEKEFEAYSETHNRHYHIKAFSPKRGYFVTCVHDSTKMGRNSLIKSNIEEQYERLFENLTSGCAIYRVINDGKSGKDYIIEAFNNKSLEIENMTEEQVVGKSLYDLRPNIDKYGLIDIFRKVWKTGESFYYPSKIYVDDIYSNYYENQVFKLSNDKIVALYNDVTDFMETQNQLKENMDKLEKYISEAPYGVFIADKNGNYLEVNKEACSITGYSEKELIGMNLTELNADDDNQKTARSFSNVKNLGYDIIENKFVKKSGEIRYWRIKAVKLSDNRFLGFAEDITERIVNEQKTKKASEETKALFDHAGVGIGYYKTNGEVIWYNRVAAKNMGGKPEDFKGKFLFDLFSHNDAKKYMSRLNAAINSNQPEAYEDHLILPIGEGWYRSTYNKIYDSMDNLLGIEVISHDITDLRKSEIALKESENRFRNMIESSQAVMLLVEPKTMRIEHANPAACDFYGWTLAEIKEKTKYDINAASRKDVDNIVQQVIKNGSGKFLLKHQLRAGIIKDVIVNSTLIEISGKKMLFSIIHDDSDRAAAEEQLRARVARYQLLFDDAPLGYQSLDAVGDIIEVNDIWLKMLGYRKEEVIGRWLGDFIVPEQRKRFKKIFFKAKKDGGIRVVFDMVKKNQEIITVSFAGRIAYNDNGDFIQAHYILEDITARLEYERKLIENEKRLNRSQKIAKTGSWEIKIGSDIIWGSDQAFAIFGIETDTNQISIEYVESFIHAEEREMAHNALQDALKGDKKYNINYRVIQNGTGDIRYVHSIAEYEYDENGNRVRILGVVRDITDQVLLEREKEQAEVLLRNQQKLESIGTLASGVAHEINNPINGILNYGQVILDTTEPDSDVNKFAEEIIYETNRVAEIVRNLLDFSRQSGQHHSYARIEDIISKTLSLVNTIFKHDDITLNVDIEKDITQIKCRSQQIQQILMNLLTNARDSLNKKYQGYHANKIINIKCFEFVSENRKWISISIEDFGMGISNSIIDRIFDPFFTTKGKDKGTGLGLSISYGIVKEHHGELKVASKEGEFTKFTLILPCDNGWEINNAG